MPHPFRHRLGRRYGSWVLVWVASAAAVALGCGDSGDDEPGYATGGAGGDLDAGGAAGSTGGLASSGGDSGSVDADGAADADQAGPPVCAVCTNVGFTCSKPGFESVSFQVDSQNPKGCAGQMVEFPNDAYTIDCVGNEVCGPAGCFFATITSNSFSWDFATCVASS